MGYNPGGESWPNTQVFQKSCSATSHVQLRTVIVFDWDDTLFPLTHACVSDLGLFGWSLLSHPDKGGVWFDMAGKPPDKISFPTAGLQKAKSVASTQRG